MNGNLRSEDETPSTTLNLTGFVCFLTASSAYYIFANSSHHYLSDRIWSTITALLPVIWLFVVQTSRKFKEVYLWSIAGLILGSWFAYAVQMAGWFSQARAV